MARRNRNVGSALAGLAAIGALGFMAGKGLYKKPGEKLADLDDRNTGGDRQSSDARLQETFMGLDDTGPAGADQGDTGDFLSRRLKVNPETGQAYSMDNLSPMGRASGARPSAGGPAAVNRADLRGYDDMYANRPAAAPVIGPRSTGRGGYTAQDIRDADGSYDALERRRLPGRAAAAAPGPQRSLNREEMISQIPGESRAAPQGGQRVSGNEFTRNVGNALAALGPTRLAGFGNAAVEGATARGAAQRASTLRAERTEAARKGQTPTKFTSTRASDSAKRTRKFDEDEAGVEFKRGGKIKKMASGGMTSASKRGDGIASKGKTKCKMY